MQRRLAAVLALDMVGYSRLMREDETRTLTRLKHDRRETIEPLIGTYGGRIFKLLGDGVLAEFPSAYNAVACGVSLQQRFAEPNGDGSGNGAESPIAYRIGINLGDVIVDGDDIYGDGVNVAARLEALATPGGVCLSEQVYQNTHGRLPYRFTDLGHHALKNIPGDIHVFSVAESGAPVSAKPQKQEACGCPSLAVLPFVNMSSDPEQDFLADGLAEEITAALSRVGAFFVIARNSAFTYKGRTLDSRQIARELGVRYLVEGSLRKAGEKVRIAVRLIDGTDSAQVWAERYDGDLDQLFDLQDRITENVVGVLEPSIRRAEIARARRKRPENLDAYDYTMRALPSVWALERTENRTALELLEQALARDPNYPLALSLQAWCYGQQLVYHWAADPAAARKTALELARRSAALGGDDPFVLTVLGATHTIVGDPGRAARLLERALAIDPNNALAWNRSGWLHTNIDQPERAIEHFERSLRLSPFDPMLFNCYIGIGEAHFVAGRYAEAVKWMRRGLEERPGLTWVHRGYIPALVFAGELEEAARRLVELRADYPDLTVSEVVRTMVFSPNILRLVGEGLRQAGLPE